MLPSILAVTLAVGMAWWSWRDRLHQPMARWAALARVIGIVALLLLLLDPGVVNRRIDRRPLVLLDNSISMHSAHGRAEEADRVAASIGDTTTFGELMRGEPGANSTLFDPLAGAVASGRAVTVVTDGEISDVEVIPPDLIAQAAIRILPRTAGADIALADVQAPGRLTVGDTLTVDIDVRRTTGAPDSASIVVRDSTTVLLHGVAKFGAGDRAHLHLAGALPHGMQGERWLQVERTGPPDAEPDDDRRTLRLTITPTPGVVVIAETPDWDSRALYRALKDVVDVPIRGFAQLQRGQWRRMDDLRPVSEADVQAAAHSADLLAVRGDTKAWRGLGRARLLWPGATQVGDWYVAAGGASPVNGAFVATDADSLPPVAGVHPFDHDSVKGWIGATARLSRRGVPVPVLIGVDDRSGRTIEVGIDGLFRWSLRGGAADQVWRTLISTSATWLLSGSAGDSVRARVSTPVTQRGRAVHFRWTGMGSAHALGIHLHGPTREWDDSLRFDGEGDASLNLAVGRYRFTLDRGAGSFAVEAYSDELFPGKVTLTEHAAATAHAAPRRSLRELIWLFAIAIAGFGTEWMLRRRLGLR